MAARPGALACQAQLYGALTDWFLAKRDVRKEEKWSGEGRGMRWGGLVNDEDSVREGGGGGERECRATQLEGADEGEII